MKKTAKMRLLALSHTLKINRLLLHVKEFTHLRPQVYLDSLTGLRFSSCASPLSLLACPTTTMSLFFSFPFLSPPCRARSLSSCVPFIARSHPRHTLVRMISNTNSTTTPPPTSPPSATTQPSLSASLFKFTRPHTIRGTILASFSGCVRALLESTSYIRWTLLPNAFLGLIALLLGNAFIVGINQIYDIRIDKINKPFLPLAANEFSPRLAWILVLSSAAAGLAIVRLFFSRLIFGLYTFGMAFGALYSVPPLRLKRYPLMAAVTISCVRGFLLNFGVYHATKSALGVPFTWSPPIVFLAVFMTVFACIIALAKDLPDVKGDRVEGVETFASRIGPERMVKFVVALLGINYIGAIAAALFTPSGMFHKGVLGMGHLVLGVWLAIYVRRGVETDRAESIRAFYSFIWKLFYAEYLLFPFI